ncbi:hypothetical protein KAZ66_04005 [Candidatus Woesebacteria bacterium]|nr:hypothetical protein [Candidatus Woesebacteria bacterium]
MVPRLLIGSDATQYENVVNDFILQHPSVKNSVYKMWPEEGRSITIEQIRLLKKELLIASHERLVVIYDFQTAKTEAQNAFLKTLEDQTEKTQFIICSNHVGLILPTILSRCQIENIASTSTKAVDEDMMHIVDAILGDQNYSFLNEKTLQVSTIEDAKVLFQNILCVLHKKIIEGNVLAAYLAQEALTLSSLLTTNNLNPQLTIDTWCMFARKSAQKK